MTEGVDRAAWVEQPGEEYQKQNPGWDKSDQKKQDTDDPASEETKSASEEARSTSLRVVDPTTLQDVPIPERQWIVQDWLPVGYTTALYGDGGVGKTLLAQQLMTSCATGLPWCGLAVKQCKTLGLFCEDDESELHRRQAQINEHYGIEFSDLGNMRWVSGVGADNFLVRFDPDGRVIRTARLSDLTDAAKDIGLIVIDTAADTFGGNENDRSQVRQYIGTILNGLAKGRAVLLNAHPSRSGMSATGDMDGGSTAWSNSVRSRWSLMRPKADDAGDADTNERILTRRKANYSSVGDELRLKWCQGVLAPVQTVSGFAGAINRQLAENVFLTLLDRCDSQNIRVSNSSHAPNFAPKIFAKRPDAEGYSRRDFDQAMSRLFTQSLITMETYGRKSDARQRIVRAADIADLDVAEAAE